MDCWMAALVLALIIVLLVMARRETFRSIYATELYPLPQLIYRKSGGVANLTYRIELFQDGGYFVYENSIPKQAGTIDPYTSDLLNAMRTTLLSSAQDNYCQKANMPADVNRTYYAIDVLTSPGSSKYRSINFTSLGCLPYPIYAGISVLDRWTIQ